MDALFDINDDGQDRGFEAAAGQTLTLKLRNPAGAVSVLFQVYDAAGANPELGVAAQPPRASKGAPELTLVGATSGQAVSPSTPGGTVTVTLPGSGSHSWIIRCVRDQGLRVLPGGKAVVDPALIHERGIWTPTAYGTRKPVSTEVQHFESEGWAGALADHIEAGSVGVPAYLAPGVGAISRSIASRLSDDIHVMDFMTAAEIAAAYAGDWSIDHQPAIQRAIHHALYQNALGFSTGRRVRLGGGMYRIDRPIHLGYGIDFRGIVFDGEGKREGGTYDGGGSGTVIRAFHDDAPAIVIQGGRSTVVRGMTIIGANLAHVSTMMSGPPAMSHLDVNAWVDPTFPASSNSRYAPYAGIAIDPYTGPQPTPHYPDVEYPAFLAGTPQYDKGQSRDVLLDDVKISGFVVGVVQHPGQADGNGDFTKLDRVLIAFCAYGFSWGNSQSRTNNLNHCNFAYVHTAFTSSTHGLRIGQPQIGLYSCHFETTIQLMEMMNLDYGAGPTLVSCYAEALYSLGKVQGIAANAGAVKFLGCQFGFWWNQYGVPTWVLEMEGSMQVSFESTFFYMAASTTRGYLNFRTAGSSIDDETARQLQFIGCSVQGIGMTQLYERAAFNATLGITCSLGSTAMDRFSVRTGYLTNLDTNTPLDAGVLYTESAIAPRHLCAPVYAKRLKSLISGNDPGVDVAWRFLGISIASVVSQVGRNVTVTLAGITTENLFYYGGDVGDVLESAATGAVFVVRSRTGNQIVMEAMSGFDKDGNLFNSIVPATLYSINARRYAITNVLLGDISAGSPTVTNLTLGNNNAPVLEDLLTVNDYLFVEQDFDQVMNPHNGDARLVSFNTGARTMTFAGNFNYTQTRRRFCVFVRPAMPNA